MKKYIDADSLKESIAKMMPHDKCGENTLEELVAAEAFADVIMEIDEMPAADVELAKEWVSVKDRLPEQSCKWKNYLVIVNRSHFPTSTYDLCDAPYDEELMATAMYDSEQKIWHLEWDEALNALIDIDDSPLNGDYITHWMSLDAIPRP